MKRTKTLTTRVLIIYKLVLFIGVLGIILLFIIYSLAENFDSIGLFHLGFMFLYFGFFAYHIFTQVKKMKYLEYDSANLYVAHNSYQIQIPFEEIKDVEIISLDGVYRFNLYQKNQIGKEILCKPSIWYPLNFKKVDEELNRIRYMIKKRKEQLHKNLSQISASNQLSGYNL